jgi:hypothetical protein
MDTVGGYRAADRANRPSAPEMPSNIAHRTWNRMTALLAPKESFKIAPGQNRAHGSTA